MDRAHRGRQVLVEIINELKTRGVNDVLIAVVDGLKGFPEAIGTVFPLTTVQTPDRGPGQVLHHPSDP